MSPEFVSPQGSYGAEADVNNFSDVTADIKSRQKPRKAVYDIGENMVSQSLLVVDNETLSSRKLQDKEVSVDSNPDVGDGSQEDSYVFPTQRKVKFPKASYLATKRIFDVAVSSFLLAVTFIFLIPVCVLIILETHGTPIYSQLRVGRNGHVFKIYKLRTMVKDSDNIEKYFTPSQVEEWLLEHKVKNDPRITPLGAQLRRFSIDELPQLINVLLGHMSLRILKTRPEFSEKSMGAFALPAKSSTNKEKAFSQVVSCFASDLRMRRISEFNCNCIGGMETQFLAKPVFGAVCA